MKTKNIILALAAMVFAVGSAFSFKDAATTAWVKVRYSTQAPGTFTCRNTGISCNDSGPTACKVRIADMGLLAAARLNSTCPAPSLLHSVAGGEAGEYDDAQQIVEIINN